MPTPDTPLNAAHQHAANAEEHESAGLLIPAAEERLKAAEMFQAAMERTSAESAKRTLSMLHNEQTKAAKDLHRRIDKLRSEGKDPTLSVRPAPRSSSSSHTTTTTTTTTTSAASPSSAHSASGATRTTNHNQKGGDSNGMAGHGHDAEVDGVGQGEGGVGNLRTMSDSHIPVDESFMLLAAQRSDPGDAFNQFWSIMQGMLDNLSQPVAFATVPLTSTTTTTSNPPTEDSTSTVTNSNVYPPKPDPSQSITHDGGLSSDTEPEEPLVSRVGRKFGFGLGGMGMGMSMGGKGSGSGGSKARRASGGYGVPEEEFDEFSIDELSESFCVVPPDSSVSLSSLKAENASLKAKIEGLKSQLVATDRILKVRKEQDERLRDSIVMARREAQRAMATSTIGVAGAGALPMPGTMPSLQRNPTGDFMKLTASPVLSPVTGGVPGVPGVNGVTGLSSGREAAQHAKRIRELEEEVKGLVGELKGARAENEKHKAVIAKFRERWDKLKESAKKKKEARARADNASTALSEQIPEESVGEQEED